MSTTARQLYGQLIEAGADPGGTYTAHAAFTHCIVPIMRRGRYESKPIKGLLKACRRAKLVATIKDWLTRPSETGVIFWVEEDL